jgi:hypothetical protein
MLTRKRFANLPLVPMFSVFSFEMVFVLEVSSSINSSAQDNLFQVSMLIFLIVSIFALNGSFRTLCLNRSLSISDRNKYLRKMKDSLLEKYESDEAHAKVDMLFYYLDSSLDSFVEGDFERSFNDAFKIAFDLNGKAFEAIYVLPENKERREHYSEIRNILSHARLSSKKKGAEKTEDEKKDFQRLKEVKKNLFRETLELLKIVKVEFVEVALKEDTKA